MQGEAGRGYISIVFHKQSNPPYFTIKPARNPCRKPFFLLGGGGGDRVRLYIGWVPLDFPASTTSPGEQMLWMPLISGITDCIILCLFGQFIPYSLLLQELDIKNLRELEVNVHITLIIHLANSQLI